MFTLELLNKVNKKSLDSWFKLRTKFMPEFISIEGLFIYGEQIETKQTTLLMSSETPVTDRTDRSEFYKLHQKAVSYCIVLLLFNIRLRVGR